MPCSSFFKSWTGFSRFHSGCVADENSSPWQWFEGEKKSFLVRLGVKPKFWVSRESAKDGICLHTLGRSPGLSQLQGRRNSPPSWCVCVACVLRGGKLLIPGWFCTFGDWKEPLHGSVMSVVPCKRNHSQQRRQLFRLHHAGCESVIFS